ncbi:ferredoxin [Candidatus Woesearchaeota archaeon]|nr:ferredoxin [Candidatus Woesearchaeota archaeon]
MAKYKIIHERDICIGCGACAAICPANWVMADDGKSKPKKTDLNEIGCNQEAADGCPVHCIHINKI